MEFIFDCYLSVDIPQSFFLHSHYLKELIMNFHSRSYPLSKSRKLWLQRTASLYSIWLKVSCCSSRYRWWILTCISFYPRLIKEILVWEVFEEHCLIGSHRSKTSWIEPNDLEWSFHSSTSNLLQISTLLHSCTSFNTNFTHADLHFNTWLGSSTNHLPWPSWCWISFILI